jgi:hypothetical protein
VCCDCKKQESPSSTTRYRYILHLSPTRHSSSNPPGPRHQLARRQCRCEDSPPPTLPTTPDASQLQPEDVPLQSIWEVVLRCITCWPGDAALQFLLLSHGRYIRYGRHIRYILPPRAEQETMFGHYNALSVGKCVQRSIGPAPTAVPTRIVMVGSGESPIIRSPSDQATMRGLS